VLINCEKLSALVSIECPEEEKADRWLISSEQLVLLEVFWDTLCFTLGKVFAQSEGIWLGEEV